MLVVVWVALAGGCASSAPLHYYTLTDAPPAARLAAPAGVMPVKLDRVTIAPELDRAQLVRRLDPTRVQIVEDQRWAAPLEDMVRRVLSADLAQRLPAGLVVDPNEPLAGEKRQSLAVDIQEFYPDPQCAVTLRAAWTVKAPDAPSARDSEEIRVGSPGACPGTDAAPAAMSQALAQLSDRIAAALLGTAAAN